MNFQMSLFFVASVLLCLIRNSDFCAVRQLPAGAAGQGVSRHMSVDSSQVWSARQGSVPALQVPDWQVSSPLQNWPSEQGVLSGTLLSMGHRLEDPSQVSATSHAPTAGRQTKVLGSLASAGHTLLVPSQKSSRSQMPADMRQTVVLSFTPSGGQVALEPVQNSVASQASPTVAARHTVVAGWKPSVGQFGPDPLQLSATSQSPADGRHSPELANPSVGHTPLLHVSATSHGPAVGRHKLPSGSGAVQLCPDSLHAAEQLGSGFGTGQGSPVWPLQVPLLHVSVPLQKTLSSQLVPSVSLVKFWSHVPLPSHSAFLQLPPDGGAVSVHGVPAATSLFEHAPNPSQVSGNE